MEAAFSKAMRTTFTGVNDAQFKHVAVAVIEGVVTVRFREGLDFLGDDRAIQASVFRNLGAAALLTPA
jgi:hypothetical protein